MRSNPTYIVRDDSILLVEVGIILVGIYRYYQFMPAFHLNMDGRKKMIQDINTFKRSRKCARMGKSYTSDRVHELAADVVP